MGSRREHAPRPRCHRCRGGRSVAETCHPAWRPVVNISSRSGAVDVPSVVSDNEAIGALAADHLLKEGYTFFASHMTSHVQFSVDRTKRFNDRVREAGYSSEEFNTASTVVPYHQSAVVVAEMIAWLQPISRRVLERRFRERLGLSPADEILRVRMERAKSLLAKTTRPLKQVASDVGYSEYPNFAIAFRREVGTSPSDFRRTHSNPNDAEADLH